MTGETLIHILPEIILLSAATVIFVAAVFIRWQDLWRFLALGAVIAAAFALVVSPEQASHLAQVEISVDSLGRYVRFLAVLAAALLVLTAWRPLQSGSAEYFACLLCATAGLMFTAGAGELVLLFVGLELVSIPTYALLYLDSRAPHGREAVLKYFFLSIAASAITLYGFANLYGASGFSKLEYAAVAVAEHANALTAVKLLGTIALIMLLTGLSFKVAAVPFHFYAPDVYEGISYPNAAFLSVFPKAAGFVALIRTVAVVLGQLGPQGWQVVMVLAALSMCIANSIALLQKNIRRLLAYSSIANAGYMLIGLAAYLASAEAMQSGTQPTWDGIGGLLLYLLVYAVATIGAFATVLLFDCPERPIELIDQLRGLAWGDAAHRWGAWLLAIFMFSLAGIPPLAGFWGKLSVFAAALDVRGDTTAVISFALLAVLGVINAAIAAAYYLRIVAVAFFYRPNRLPDLRPESSGTWIAAVACAVLVVVIGVYWQPSLEVAQQASPVLHRSTVSSLQLPSTLQLVAAWLGQ